MRIGNVTGSTGSGEELNAELDALLLAYRQACPEPEASADFMPGVWAKIENRESSSFLFSRLARALVTAALAASVILGTMAANTTSSVSRESGSYLEALAAEHTSSLDPLSLERIAELEQQ